MPAQTAENKHKASIRAKERGFGGNTKHQRTFTDQETLSLVKKYERSNNKLTSLFTNKVFISNRAWMNDVSIYMDLPSRSKLYAHIAMLDHPVCNNPACGISLCVKDYNQKERRMPKYCTNCIVNKVWLSIRPVTTETRQKISQRSRAFCQTPEGKSQRRQQGLINSTHMKEFHTTEAGALARAKSAEVNSAHMRRKIANGYTPPFNNRWTHWNAVIIHNGKTYTFRSSWEACFWLSNPHMEYEIVRIPYVDENSKARTYIADFFDVATNTVYEIKPSSVYVIQQHKMDAVINYCLAHNITFIWVNEHNILKFVDESVFFGDNINQLTKMKSQI